MEPNIECQWPSVAWWDAFAQQATKETFAAAERVAINEIARLALLGRLAPWGHDDIVQQLLTDACEGRRRWDPRACSLRTHLCDKVRHAARCLRDRRRKISIVVELDDLDDADPIWADNSLASDGHRIAAMRDLAKRVDADLWQRAAGDPIALRVLRAWSEGRSGEEDLADGAELPIPVVRNAMRRIRRMILALPDQLVSDARDLLSAEAPSDGLS